MERNRSAVWAIGVLVAAVVIAGCANPALNALPNKPAVAATTPAAPPCQTTAGVISACVRLGDLTTLDPCSLITAGQLPPDLAAKPSDRDSLDHCDFTITAGSEKNVTLEIGQLESEGVTPGPVRFRAGAQQLQPEGLELQQGTLYQGECDDAVEFTGDQVDLDISVFVLDGSAGSQSLCDAANEVGTALGAVIASNAPVRHFTVPKDSIARIRSCDLINGTQVGSDTLDGQVGGPSEHYCQWTPDGGSGNEYGVDLEIGTKLDASDTDGQVQIHGLPTVVLKSSESSYSRCELDTYRAPWGGGAGGLVEIASVWASLGAGQTDEACSQATQMANAAWPKLPSIS